MQNRIESYPWLAAHKRLATAVLERRRDRGALIDALAYALEESCVSLPIIENGEDLNDICPFTIFAAFCRPLDDNRRVRLFTCLCDALGLLDVRPPESFEGLALVQDRQARLFGRGAAEPLQIEALWNLFAVAMERDSDEAGMKRVQAQVENLRLPGRTVLPIVLSWVRPDAFPPPRACTPETPVLDPKKTAKLFDAYGAHLLQHDRDDRTRRAVRCFQARWNEEADDVAAMLSDALAESHHLLFKGYFFNPHKEMLAFAQAEPEATRHALRSLFDEKEPLIERICRFEAETARLFEQHRALVANAVPRRSSHGNYYTACVYLFLRYPDRHPLYSPRRLKALDQATGYGCSYRIAHPESVTRFAELCEALKPALRGWIGVPGRRPDSAGAELRMTTNADSSRDAELNLLIEELALFACARTPA